jgi:hypothetical protein
MAAQVPALFEALSGMQLSELLVKVKMIGPDGEKVRPAAWRNNPGLCSVHRTARHE